MDLVTAARGWIGTPFRHQGRNKLGIDCLGLLLVAAKDCGVALDDLKGYPRTPDGHTLRAECEKQLIKKIGKDLREGDILLMSFGRYPQHIAIKTDIGIIHAFQESGRVVEHNIDQKWLNRIKEVYVLG